MNHQINIEYRLPEEQQILSVVQQAMREARFEIQKGKVATYIPELGRVNPNQLGIVILPVGGGAISLGDYQTRFTIQSISKVFSLGAALELYGADRVFQRVGAEPTGEAFNSLIELEQNSGKPFNPLVNSGAIAIVDMICQDISFDKMVEFYRDICDDAEITLNQEVYESEIKTCARNRAIAYLLESKGILTGSVENTIDFYTRLCSLNVTAESLAKVARLLADDGVDHETGDRHMSSETARILKTLMLTCGMYDGSGSFAVKVGIPTKSGVGGGLLAVSDKRAGIGIFGPALDEQGNSIAGCELLRLISKKLKLNLFYDPEWDEVPTVSKEILL